MDTINLVNNGKPYFFRLDIAKESGQIARFTDWIKSRVSDNGKKVPIQWYDQGTVMNVHGFYPFIEGGVGKWIKDDDTGELVPSTDVVYRTWQGTPADTSDNGIAYYTLEDQFFIKQGEFVGTFGLRDDNGNNLTSVNLVFSILGNDLRLTQAKDYYIKDLENLKRKFENDGNQAVKDFNTKIEAGTEIDRQALDALRASIQANRDGQASITEQQAAITSQIKTQNIITKPEYDNDIKTISNAINNRLSQMKTAPVGVKSLADLTNTYPNGADGTFVTADTQHLYVWLDNQWTDLGTYQAATLDKDVQETLGALKAVTLKDNLIKNGGFGYDNPAPAYSAGTAVLGTFKFLGRNWLTVSTPNPAAYQGVRWKIDNPFNTLGSTYPLHLEFNIATQDRMNLILNLVGYDSSDNRIGGDSGGLCVDTFSTQSWRFYHKNYKIRIPDSMIGANYFVLEILQIETKTISQIRLTGIQMNVIFDTNDNKLNNNLLANAIDIGVSTHSDTQSGKLRFADKDWIQISDPNIRGFNGLSFAFNNPYKDYQILYPLHFETTLMSAETAQYNIVLYGIDANGTRIGGDSGGTIIKSLIAQSWLSTKVSENFFIDSSLLNATQLVIQIVQPTTKALSTLRVSDIVAKPISYHLSTKDILDNSNIELNGLQNITSNTNDSTISAYKYLNETWIKIVSQGSAWAGVQFNITGHTQYFDTPVKLSLDCLSEEALNLQLDLAYYDVNGKQLGLQAIKQGWQLPASKLVSYNISFNLDPQYRNADRYVLQICTPDNKAIKNLNLKNVSLINVAPAKRTESTWDLDVLEKMYGLPVVKINGDLSNMNHDNAKKIVYEYKNRDSFLSGYGTLKWQGDSSALFDKKGYRLKTLQADYKSKDKIRVLPSWDKHSKFNLKAYYTDGLLARDPIAANIGARIWSERNDLPTDLVNEDNFGFIDGFPITLIINDTYEGVYWFNLPRPDFDYTKYAIIGSEYTSATNFEKLPEGGVKLDGSDFESLNPEDKPSDGEKKAVNDLIDWVVKANDATFKADLEKHFNKNSLIDYLVFTNIVGDRDAYGKNQILMTWDGKVWYYQAYDLDCIYNANWMGGKTFDTPSYNPSNPTNPTFGDNSRLFRLLSKIFYDEICERYTQVRQWCTPGYVLNLFKNATEKIGIANYQREWAKWNDPSRDTEDFKQLKRAVYDHFKLADQTYLKKPSTKAQAEQLKAQIETLKKG
ncbi:CotH kinase family protein [Lactobacillus taiwanensis]|uniref:Uncharacterized protein n=1 Tax=Lactobacillus taiwanensis TaxID=508451 RepID=A0A256LEF8_9LACO|nr:CotH kinase family protein [Lactobacillus taiwanensis]OYR87326.1 hypothetical protein CBF53_07700 [Lactobacillus taiwanensis]OYR90947.1 hypothetical protein CBF70_07145 [Lactobacillus taiwanensis]OYR91853.1 hypothetical protein CBF59_04930 [Lactobacillus taiwanensis]